MTGKSKCMWPFPCCLLLKHLYFVAYISEPTHKFQKVYQDHTYCTLKFEHSSGFVLNIVLLILLYYPIYTCMLRLIPTVFYLFITFFYLQYIDITLHTVQAYLFAVKSKCTFSFLSSSAKTPFHYVLEDIQYFQ